MPKLKKKSIEQRSRADKERKQQIRGKSLHVVTLLYVYYLVWYTDLGGRGVFRRLTSLLFTKLLIPLDTCIPSFINGLATRKSFKITGTLYYTSPKIALKLHAPQNSSKIDAAFRDPIFLYTNSLVLVMPYDVLSHLVNSWSTLVQVMACYLMAPNHNLNQCRIIIKIYPSAMFKIIIQFSITEITENYILKIYAKSPRVSELTQYYLVMHNGSPRHYLHQC